LELAGFMQELAASAKKIMQKLIQRKLGLFGHIYRMSDERRIKALMFGWMDGANRIGRPCRE
jgi:hypothetical protein